MAVDAPFANVRGERTSVAPVGGSATATLISALDGTLKSNIAIRQEVQNSAKNLNVLAERTDRMHGAFRDVQSTHKALVASIADSVTSTAQSVVARLSPALDAARDSAAASAAAAVATNQAAQAALSGLVLPKGAAVAAAPGLAALGTALNPMVVTTLDPKGKPVDPKSPGYVPLVERTATVDQGKGRAPSAKAVTGKDEGGGTIVDPATGATRLNPYEQYQRGKGVSLSGLRQTFGHTIQASGEGVAQRAEGDVDATGPNLRWKAGVVREGKHVGGQKLGAKDIKGFQRATRFGRIATNYGSSIAEAGSLGEGLGAALPGAFGPVGLAIGAGLTIANKGADAAHAQREANNQFISVEGGAQGGALMERGREKLFGIGQRFTGGLDGAQSDTLFMGATRLGLKGNERQQALNFGVQNYKKFGMDVSDSLELMATAAEHGNHNLDGLSTALDSVTKAAKEGGVNAQEAAKNFQEAFKVNASRFENTNTARDVTADTQNSLSVLGDPYKNINTSGTTSERMMRMMAAQFPKMSYQHIVQSVGSAEFTKNLTTMQRNAATQALGGSGSLNNRKFDELLATKKKGKNGRYSEEDITELAQSSQVEKGGSGLDPTTAVTFVRDNMGYDVTPSEAFRVIAQVRSGNLDAARADAEAFGKSKKFGSKEKDAAARIGVKNGKESSGTLGLGASLLDGNGKTSAQNAYLREVKKTGQASPLVERLLSDYDSINKDKRKISINGKTMSLQEAMTHHRTQLERGEGSFVGGGKDVDGKKITDVLNLRGDTAANTPGDPNGKTTAGSVTLSLKPEVAKWFLAQTAGNISTSTSPGDPYPAPDKRASGQVVPGT